MFAKRMHDLGLRYGVPPSYMYRIPFSGKYVSTLGPLEAGCERRVFKPLFAFLCMLLLRSS